MTFPSPDLPYVLADALLGRLTTRLTTEGRPVEWSTVQGGATITPMNDDCGGMAWTRVAMVYPTDGNDAPLRALQDSSGGNYTYTAKLEVGVLRCATGIDEQGYVADITVVAAEATTDALDRLSVVRSVTCDFITDMSNLGVDGFLPGAWLPLSPDAQTTGGYMTVDCQFTYLTGVSS